jgi:hypothetical protein
VLFFGRRRQIELFGVIELEGGDSCAGDPDYFPKGSIQVWRVAKNPSRITPSRGPFYGHINTLQACGRRVSFSARSPSSYLGSARQGVAIIPGLPFLRAGGQFPGMALKFDQVVEGVGTAQLAGVDQAHEQIADLRTVQGAIV